MLNVKKFFVLLPMVAVIFYGVTANASNDELKLNSETKAEITTQLTQEGYEVRKIKTEDGFYEAYAMKDGVRYEVYLNEELKIVKVKED